MTEKVEDFDDFFKFNKADCISLFDEVGKIKSSDDITTQLKVIKLNKYRTFIQGELIWQSAAQYLDLINDTINDLLVDDLNLDLLYKGVAKFSISITEKLKSLSELTEILLDNSIVLSPSKVGSDFSKRIIEIAELVSSYDDLNSTQDDILSLLERIIYLHKRLIDLVNNHLDSSTDSI